MLIAIIFINESFNKLFKIINTHKYTSNPFLYSKDFNSNSTQCFRCRHTNTSNDPHEYMLNASIYTERKCEELGLEYQFVRECEHIPDVFFFCVILYVCTFLMAISLRKIKFSSFFPSWVFRLR